MAVIYLRLSKRHNELNRNEIIMTFRQGSTIYQRAGTGIFILDKPSYWDGEKMVLRARSMTEEVKYHREMKHKLEDLPNCPMADEVMHEVEESVKRVPGVTGCTIELTFEPVWDRSMLSEEARVELGLDYEEDDYGKLE